MPVEEAMNYSQLPCPESHALRYTYERVWLSAWQYLPHVHTWVCGNGNQGFIECGVF